MSPTFFRPESNSWRRRLSLLWALGVMAASIEPHSIKAHLKTSGGFHLFTHFVAFGAGALAASGSRSAYRHWAYAVSWLAFVAFTSEYLESLVYVSSFEWRDLAADMIGALSGLAILAFWNRRHAAANRVHSYVFHN
jgi:hypothetical protein